MLLFVVFIIFYSCTKEIAQQTVSESAFQTNIIGGTGVGTNVQKKWIIDSIFYNGISLNLTPASKGYSIVFKSDSTYFDSDSYEGTWSILSINKLKIVTKNILIASRPTVLIYDILELNPYKLSMSYIDSSVKRKIVYKLSN